MAGSTIDHLIAVTAFLAAFLLFITLFSQTLQTAILYQRHRQIALKCSDLLDNMLLNPGYPEDWGQSNVTPSSFGLQDPDFTRYMLSPFSLMRLASSVGEPVYYPKTGLWYSNITMGFGNFLLVPYTQAINYTLASKLLGINGTYGFQLTLTPVVTVSISLLQIKDPLKLAVNVAGVGFPLANAQISYIFLTVETKDGGQYPSYSIKTGSASTDNTGSAILEFPGVDGTTDSYGLIAYAYLCGLVGIGYYEHATETKQYIIPFIDDLKSGRVIIAHSYDVHYFGPPVAAVFYNATFVVPTEDFTLREIPIENSTGKIGNVTYGEGWPYRVVTIPTYNPGILVITYRKGNEDGVILMPWGISSLAFPVVFGADPSGNEWVVTDSRQVIVNGIVYQARLALWRMQDFPVLRSLWIGVQGLLFAGVAKKGLRREIVP